MKSLFLLWTVCFHAVLVGCAAKTVQTDALLQKPPLSLASKAEIREVPFVQQSSGYCGPATLTMALQFRGKPLKLEDVAPQVYTPGVKGTFQSDMISASRRQGMIAIPIQGLNALLTEVSGGNPVIVFENLALSWLPQWHYAIVFGYDLQTPEVTLHSGPEAFKHWDLRKFERSWMLADYWGLVVLNPGELSATASEFAHVKATAALESLGSTDPAQLDRAKTSYERILKKWPDSLGAAIGNGNIAYSRKAYSEAVQYLQQATKFHPQSAVAWHNLTLAYGATHAFSKAKASAQEALKWASDEERAQFLQSLKDWL